MDNKDVLGVSAYNEWCESVLKALSGNPSLKLVIFEIGCGLRVPNLRKRCEELYAKAPVGTCDFVRINPEFEDHKIVSSPSISIKASGLEALRAIQFHLEGRAQLPISNSQEQSASTTQNADNNLNALRSGVKNASRGYARANDVLVAAKEDVGYTSTVPEPRVMIMKGVGKRQVRVVCISDTHALHSQIKLSDWPAGDVLIHCGDFTKKGSKKEVEAFSAVFCSLPYRTKILIAGNHDVGLFCEFQPKDASRFFPGVRYLQNALVEVEGLKIYGSPWDCRTKRSIPTNVDILVTHDPPKDILDKGLGCEYLRQEVAQQQPRVHVFGHIHEAAGVLQEGVGADDVKSTTFINCAMANDGMVARRLDKSMVVIDLEP